MRLSKVHITDFQSIQDSTEFKTGDITCLVGKNEAGKTAILKSLYRLNSINEADGNFDLTADFPRQTLTEYEDDIAAGRREPAQVVQATYVLESSDITAVESVFGPKCLIDNEPTVTIAKGYSNELTFSGLSLDAEAGMKHLIEAAGLPAALADQLLQLNTAQEMLDLLNSSEQTEASEKLIPMLQEISGHDVPYVVYHKLIGERIPKFLYFDEYYQMKGQDNLDSLTQRVAAGNLEDSDYPLLGLIQLAGLNLDTLASPGRTEALISRLEAAGNHLTQKVLPYWSQNQHLRMKFDIRPAQPEDPPGMTSGKNIWGRVENTRYFVTTPLGTRSRGFVWFFSFLAWYQKLRQENENLILLLDEPGLSLHAKAQADLLRYFEEELKPHHQLIYTTHSPFMVDPTNFGRVRIVQDLSIEADSEDLPAEQQGTKVITEVLDATPDSLFPLQGALGYEISQTLFVGPNCLIVEGVSDLIYIQVMSALLQAKGKTGLSADWTITPVGGSDKVQTFVALIGAQSKLNIAVLIDYQKKDKQSIENLYKEKLLEQKAVLTYANFAPGTEADIEDMFDPNFYLQLVSGEFGTSLTVNDLPAGSPRILSRLEKYFENHPLPKCASFNHYRPARYFSENIGTLGNELTDSQLARFQQAFDDLNSLL